MLAVVEHHDDAYRAWRHGERTGDWQGAEARARRLLDALGDDLGLYLRFYRSDNETGAKASEPYTWFERLAAEARRGSSGTSATSPSPTHLYDQHLRELGLD